MIGALGGAGRVRPDPVQVMRQEYQPDRDERAGSNTAQAPKRCAAAGLAPVAMRIPGMVSRAAHPSRATPDPGLSQEDLGD